MQARASQLERLWGWEATCMWSQADLLPQEKKESQIIPVNLEEDLGYI